VLGQVHPRTAQAFGIGEDVYLFEVRLAEILSVVPAVLHFEPFSRYPAVVEDLAVVVDRDTSAGSVLAEIQGHPLVVSARLFDVYEGEQVDAGMKSLAFSIAYQARDRTLTDADVRKARERILSRLRSKLGAELRG